MESNNKSNFRGFFQTNTPNCRGTIFKIMGGELAKRKSDEIYHVENKKPKIRDPTTFNETNLENITILHANPLVLYIPSNQLFSKFREF